MMASPVERLNAALEGRYRIERNLGELHGRGGIGSKRSNRDLRLSLSSSPSPCFPAATRSLRC